MEAAVTPVEAAGWKLQSLRCAGRWDSRTWSLRIVETSPSHHSPFVAAPIAARRPFGGGAAASAPVTCVTCVTYGTRATRATYVTVVLPRRALLRRRQLAPLDGDTGRVLLDEPLEELIHVIVRA